MANHDSIILIPDVGPLVELAECDQLDTLFNPGWTVSLVDTILHEILRNPGPASNVIGRWVASTNVPVLQTQAFVRAQQAISLGLGTAPQMRLAEVGMQEVLNAIAHDKGSTTVLLLDEHKAVHCPVQTPKNCKKISTRAYRLFLEERGVAVQPKPIADAIPPAEEPAQILGGGSEAIKAAQAAFSSCIETFRKEQVTEKIQVVSGAAIRLLGMRKLHAQKEQRKLSEEFKNLMN